MVLFEELKFSSEMVYIRLRRAVNFLIPLEIDVDPGEDGSNRTVESQSVADPPANGEDDDGFYGFSSDDVQRTLDNLRLFNEASAGHSDTSDV
jgi:hypothetical protein